VKKRQGRGGEGEERERGMTGIQGRGPMRVIKFSLK